MLWNSMGSLQGSPGRFLHSGYGHAWTKSLGRLEFFRPILMQQYVTKYGSLYCCGGNINS
nr:hypothetical protein Iba_chr05cCG9970 [Ipomoea batatas]GME10435.1 hypothetical protein Iba_scaffold10073CG0500 [Ipomoea batatas]